MAKAAKKAAKTAKPKKAANQTVLTKQSASAFIASVANEQRRADAKALAKLMQDATSEKPAMWGPAIVGYGGYHYKYESGREGDMPKVSFSPRAGGLVLYLSGLKEAGPALKKLGKHKVSGGCLHIAKLADVDASALRELVARSFAQMTAKYG